MWRGVLPCPHRLPSCLPAPPLRDPGRASQTLCSRGWELLGGGSPGKRFPLRHSEGRGLSPRPPPQPSRAESPWPPAPSPHPSASLSTRSPPAPAPRPSPSVYPPPFPLRRRCEVSGKRVGEADARRRRNHVATAARRIPGDTFRLRPRGPAAEAGVSRRRRRAESPPQPGSRPASAPAGWPGDPLARNTARPCSRETALRGAASRSGPEPPR